MGEPVSNSYKLDDLTTGEAAAWRAARDAAASAAFYAAIAARASFDAARAVRDAIRAMEPPR